MSNPIRGKNFLFDTSLQHLEKAYQAEQRGLQTIQALLQRNPTLANEIFRKVWEKSGKPNHAQNPSIAHDKFGKAAFFNEDNRTVSLKIKFDAVNEVRNAANSDKAVLATVCNALTESCQEEERSLQTVHGLTQRNNDAVRNVFFRTWQIANQPTREKNPDIAHDDFGKVAFLGEERRSVSLRNKLDAICTPVMHLENSIAALKKGNEQEAIQAIETLMKTHPGITKVIFRKIWEKAGSPTRETNWQIAHDNFGKVAFFNQEGRSVSLGVKLDVLGAVRTELEELAKAKQAFSNNSGQEGLNAIRALMHTQPSIAGAIFGKVWEKAGSPTRETRPDIAHDHFGRVAFFNEDRRCSVSSQVKSDAVNEAFHDLFGIQNISSSSHRVPLAPAIALDPLKISNQPERAITAGHGEYIVYHRRNTGEKVAPSRETFERAYAIFNQFNSPSIDNRYQIIQQKIKAIDPSLEITFVPRTYYDMHFLQQGIKEDQKRGDFCPNEHKEPNSYLPNNTKDCWHIAYFQNQPRVKEDNNAEAVKALAFNMNQSLIKKVQKHPLKGSSLTFKTISDLANKKIQFFKTFHDTFNLQNQRNNRRFTTSVFGEGTVLEKFSNDRHRFAMGIKDEKDAKMYRNAIDLECHSIAEKAFLLYRGSDFPTDLPYSPQNINQPYSYSFGSSLLAGAMNCGNAATIVYAKSSPDAYVMVVPAQDSDIDLIDFPRKHAICDLTTARDVVFHPRTKVWRTNESVWGFGDAHNVKSIVEPYFCNLDRETLTDRILSLKNKNVVFLKSSTHETLAVPSAFQPTIHVHASVPPGKTLYIRGNEGGLNWQKGQPLVQVDDHHWTYRLSKNFNQLEYKILIDDEPVSGWEEGDNRKFELGNNVIKPNFRTTPLHSLRKSTRLSIRYNAVSGKTPKIYGTGPGMSWNKGVPLKNVGQDLWIWDTSESFDNFEYKIVLNDVEWEKGPNHRSHHGKKEEILPRF
jgi:hypothetical protein